MIYIFYVSEIKGTFSSILPHDVDVTKFCERILRGHDEPTGHYKMYSVEIPSFAEGGAPIVKVLV